MSMCKGMRPEMHIGGLSFFPSNRPEGAKKGASESRLPFLLKYISDDAYFTITLRT